MKMRLSNRRPRPPTCRIIRNGRVIYKGPWFSKGKRIWTKMLAPHLARWWEKGGGP